MKVVPRVSMCQFIRNGRLHSFHRSIVPPPTARGGTLKRKRGEGLASAYSVAISFLLYWSKGKEFENPNFLRFSDQPSKREEEVIGIQSINGGFVRYYVMKDCVHVSFLSFGPLACGPRCD